MKKLKIKVRYESGNSGGNWWLSDEDWKNLEKAGWKVKWFKNEKPRKDCEYCEGTGKITKKGKEKVRCGDWKIGEKCAMCLHADKDGKFLGALATEAEKSFGSITEAIKEFEKITKQDVSAEGCNHCGAPHTFWFGKKECFDYKCDHKPDDKEHGWTFCSGEDCLKYLFPDKKIPKNLREAIEGRKK